MTEQDIADAILVEWVVRYGLTVITYDKYEAMRNSYPIDVYLSVLGYIDIEKLGFASSNWEADAKRQTWITPKGKERLQELGYGQ